MLIVKKKDFTGLRFNRVIATKFIGKYRSYTSAWECLCDCGKSFITAGYALETGHTKSCGCLKYDYNSLVGKDHPWCHIIKKLNGRSKGTSALYECRCKLCDRIFEKNSSHLHDVKKYKSCGCTNPKMGHAPGIASAKDVFDNYKRNAKKRNLCFDITFEQFLELSSRNCDYCGQIPKSVARISKNGQYVYNGLDRFDNEKGYLLDNIKTCCGMCNQIKMNFSFSEFTSKIAEIFKYLGLS